MDIIELYFNDFKLGELTFSDNKYFFKSDKQANNLLIRKEDSFLNTQSPDNTKKFDELPALFNKFLPKDEKAEKLMTQIGIYKEDNDFIKLLKISRLELSRETFWIKAINKEPK